MTRNLSRLTLVGLWITLVMVASGCQSGSLDAGDLPPAGTVWFGDSFDPETFEVSGRTTTGTAGKTMGVVARLARTIDMSNANLRIGLDGTTIANRAVGLEGDGDAYAVTYTFPVAGKYLFEITDIGGNVLASGTIEVR